MTEYEDQCRVVKDLLNLIADDVSRVYDGDSFLVKEIVEFIRNYPVSMEKP
jgi:hypothetical protein